MLITIGPLLFSTELQSAIYVKFKIYKEVEELDCRAIYDDIKFDHT